MASTLNRVTLRGHLGKDPEIKVFQGGGKMATISIATSNNWKDKNTNEWKSETHWHNVVVKFNDQLIDRIESECKKGSHVYVEGQLITRKYQDKNQQDRYVTEVVVTGSRCLFDVLDKKERDDSDQNQDSSYGQKKQKPLDTNYYGNDNMIDDEVPF